MAGPRQHGSELAGQRPFGGGKVAALEMVQGRPHLPGQPFADLEEWSAVRALVARLTETRCVAEEALASVMLASDRTTKAVTLLETLVVEQPLRERRWVLYLLALDCTGRRAEALRAFSMPVTCWAISVSSRRSSSVTWNGRSHQRMIGSLRNSWAG